MAPVAASFYIMTGSVQCQHMLRIQHHKWLAPWLVLTKYLQGPRSSLQTNQDHLIFATYIYTPTTECVNYDL